MKSKPFKIITLLGIRPDLIRTFKLIDLLDKGQKKHGYKHVFAHTGQHFDYELDGVFYKELGIRKPDINLQVGKTLKERGGNVSHPYQMALLFERVAGLLEKEKPDAVLFLGDTNSVLASMVVARSGTPVIHVEAGGRSFDWRMPEEKNRIIIDHLADAHYSYLPRYRNILISEGIDPRRVLVVGNVIYDSLNTFLPKAQKSKVLEELNLVSKSYALCTIHREENIVNKSSLVSKVAELIKLSEQMPVVFPVMPRTKANIDKLGLLKKIQKSKVILAKPQGYLDFLKLEQNAKVIITDSGTVQEEALILGVPAVIIRRSTERPETMLARAAILTERDIVKNVNKVLKFKINWNRQILNPTKKSPTENIYKDLVKKIKTGFFTSSRDYDQIKYLPFVKQAYGNK